MRAHFRAIILGTLSVLLVGNATAGGLSGAIYTTNQAGTFVNGNVYDAPEDVYLNGGPRANQSCSAAGLPDGDYYFQVTDPPGKILISGGADNDHKISCRQWPDRQVLRQPPDRRRSVRRPSHRSGRHNGSTLSG